MARSLVPLQFALSQKYNENLSENNTSLRGSEKEGYIPVNLILRNQCIYYFEFNVKGSATVKCGVVDPNFFSTPEASSSKRITVSNFGYIKTNFKTLIIKDVFPKRVGFLFDMRQAHDSAEKQNEPKFMQDDTFVCGGRLYLFIDGISKGLVLHSIDLPLQPYTHIKDVGYFTVRIAQNAKIPPESSWNCTEDCLIS